MEGKIGQARRFLEAYETTCPHLRLAYQHWLSDVFGFQSETDGNQEQDVLRLMTSFQPNHFKRLNPSRIFLRSENHIVKQVYDTLIKYDEKKAQFQPHLVHFWECDPEQKVWTFFLRKGVYFHHGQLLTAEDVRYTFERFLNDSENKYKWLAEDIDEIRVKDDYTFDICLHTKNTLLLYYLCDERLSIICEQSADRLVNGTGPFRLIRQDGKMLALKAHEHYFKGRAFLDRIELWYMDSHSSVVSYGYDMAIGTESKINDEWYIERNIQYVSINMKRPGPLQHKVFRQALKQIISPVEMVNELAGQRTTPTAGFMHVSDVVEKQAVDLLLEECCYQGEPLKLYTFAEQDHQEDTAWIKKRCERFGIMIEPYHFQAEELIREDIIYQADLIHDSATFNDSQEISWFHLLFTKNSFLHIHLSPEWEEKVRNVKKQLCSIDEHDNRIKLLSDLDRELTEEVCALPLYQNKIRVKAGQAIKGIVLNQEGWINFYDLWFGKYSKLT
ncbi:SgrR family transcriptional regulator [Bacillus sp. WMMC1349]|uniref:ABC transporter substrate-binding protein n=1 Tax=Bacillus sp. WMMC1349 TaxID=2736254 RepID=UPI0015560150|nr:ABC transporter substrate-binding protein [Bacillus sp. WMMC1349]NPC92122.1 SgrR family transcriptional regulator [Bacillus sp. WMMC1349]